MAFGDDPLDGLTLADYVGDDWQDGYVRLGDGWPIPVRIQTFTLTGIFDPDTDPDADLDLPA
jgi:hypothetical protein